VQIAQLSTQEKQSSRIVLVARERGSPEVAYGYELEDFKA